MDLPALEDLGSQRHVFQTAVGAGTDNNLLDRHVAHFVDGLSVFRQMRERNRRLQLGQVDVIRRNVFRVFVWCKDFPFALCSASQIVFCDLIYHEDAVLGSGFDSHVGDAETVFHGQAL